MDSNKGATNVFPCNSTWVESKRVRERINTSLIGRVPLLAFISRAFFLVVGGGGGERGG